MRTEPRPELEIDHARERLPLPIKAVVDLDDVDELGLQESGLGGAYSRDEAREVLVTFCSWCN